MKELKKRILFFTVILFFTSICFANNNSALIVHDMQDFFVTRDGYHTTPENVKKVKQVIATQVDMIKQAINLGLPIIFVEYEGFGETNETLKAAVANYKNVKYFKKDTGGMFDKGNRNKKALVDYLEEKRIDTLVITGANGGACALDSIHGALKNNYSVIAFSQGIADFNYKDFIYPYANQYTYIKPKCTDCSLKEASSIEGVKQALGFGSPSPSAPPTFKNTRGGLR